MLRLSDVLECCRDGEEEACLRRLMFVWFGLGIQVLSSKVGMF